MNWAYGVTTVDNRITTLLPATLASLKLAGFDKPVIFADGVRNYEAVTVSNNLGLQVVHRDPNANPFNNWVLALWELWCRNPTADRWAIFQDDLLTYRNLRQYLEQCYPENGYLNLYTFPSNQKICPRDHVGWYQSNQLGRGAVALVFDKKTVAAILQSPEVVMHPFAATLANKKIDGVVVTALAKAGIKEWVHNPSLCQHTGNPSSINNPDQPQAESFKGSDYDAIELVQWAKQPAACSQSVTSFTVLSKQSASMRRRSNRGLESRAIARNARKS